MHHFWGRHLWDEREQAPVWTSYTVITTNTTNIPTPEERLREIVREEIGQLPIKYDVPDSP